MLALIKKYKRKLIIFLGVFGPGVIAAIADNDAGGVATYSILASKYGYSMLFLLIPVTFLLAITQEIGARISIVSGRGFGDLIREYFGVRVSLVIFTLLLIVNLGTIITNFAGMASAFRLMTLPILPSLFVITLLIIFFVFKGNYQTNQKIFLIASVFYGVYIISAFMSNPNWGQATQNLVLPDNIQMSFAFLLGAIALLGTTVTPWGQFFISSFVRDKQLTIDKLKYEKLEVFFGAFLTSFFSFFIVVAVASTLFVHKIEITSSHQAALAITPFAGQFSQILFGLGLFVASFMGVIIVSLTTAYAFSEFFGYEGSLDLPYHESRQFHAVFLFQIFIALFTLLIPNISLFQIVLFTQSLNGVLLPVLIYFLLHFANDKQIMGRHINSNFYNWFSKIAASIIVAASLFLVIGAILGKI